MKPLSFMVIAGEPSGDQLGAELVRELQLKLRGNATAASQKLQFFGGGGQRLADAGVEILEELARSSVIGVTDVLANYRALRAAFHRLISAACDRQPDVIILVDYSHFNHRFAEEIRAKEKQVGSGSWHPSIVKYVSPQVWASRPGRAKRFPATLDLLLCIFPFEVEWYKSHTPDLKVRYVGHPVLDRYKSLPNISSETSARPLVLLLPGSRRGELKRHVPVIAEAAQRIEKCYTARFVMVLPSEELTRIAAVMIPEGASIELKTGELAGYLPSATLAIASTGSVLMECARFLLPTVALYKTSWLTYTIGRALVNVPYLGMPNLLAKAEIFPEFIQQNATATNLATAALRILQNQGTALEIREQLRKVIGALGEPGASERAATAVVDLIQSRQRLQITPT